MSRSYLLRQSLLFWQESFLAASLLMLLGWLPSVWTDVAAFVGSATLLLVLGLWLYDGGARNLLLHLLLYPLVFAVGVLIYQTLDSVLFAALAAALFYWRVHSLAASSYSQATLLNAWIMTLCISLAHLAIASLFGPLRGGAPFQAAELYPVIALLVAGYMLASLGEYLTREDTASLSVRVPRVPAFLGVQLIGSRLLLAAGYAAAAGMGLWVLSLLWGWMKKPLGAALSWIFGPLLKGIGDWIEKLSASLGSNRKVQDLLEQSSGNREELPQEEAAYTGEALFTLWQPYLIAACVLLVGIGLGWAIWKRRGGAQVPVSAAPAEAVEATLHELPPEKAGTAPPIWDLEALRAKAHRQEDDPVRYGYYQFLLHMADAGLSIAPYETPHEYLCRLQQRWTTSGRLEYAARITRYYEQSRYMEKPLTNEELADLQHSVAEIRKMTD